MIPVRIEDVDRAALDALIGAYDAPHRDDRLVPVAIPVRVHYSHTTPFPSPSRMYRYAGWDRGARIPDLDPAARLQRVDVLGGRWTIQERMTRSMHGTGGTYSVAYLARDRLGNVGFVTSSDRGPG